MDVIRMKKVHTTQLNLRGIGWFLVLAFAIAWLLELPMLLDRRGLNSPWAMLYSAVNFAPAIATFAVIRWISPVQEVRKATGLRFGAPGSRWVLYRLFGWLGFIAFGIAAPFVGALFGLFPLDLTDFSLYRKSLENTPGGEAFLALGSMETVVLIGLLTLPLWTLLLTPFSLGEEWGWRGYLLPKLLPLGQWPALLISGAIWGIWHAPLIVLGANYPGYPILGILLMIINCMIVGTILGWTRLATGSIWPAVLGHAGFNASVGAAYIFGQSGIEYDQAQVTLAGWTGWILPLLFIVFLMLTRNLPVRKVPELASRATSETTPVTADQPSA
jgi:membrane protease YdiL (CAAX protease family)